MRVFWFEQALQQDREGCAPTLYGDITADVCIVGGGYTGLWTAIQLKQKQPDLDVTIVEADLCGAGASGRNGGCMMTWATKYFTLERLFGEREAVRLVRASEEAVHAVTAFCREQRIEAQVRQDGTLYTATNDAQRGATDAVVARLEALGVNSWRALSREEVQHRAASSRHLSGIFSPVGATVHPGLLVRGLRRAALRMGVRLYENTPMRHLERGRPPVVRTPQGSVRAGKVVLALNAAMPTEFPQFRRAVVLVSSDMIITAPRPDLLERIRLDNGIAVMDSRIFVHYYRTTTDGRLMLGKGGNTFAFGGRMLKRFDEPSPYRQSLTDALHAFFPAFADVPVAASWNGASERSATGLPFFARLDDHPDIFYGFGYSGNGVGPTYMGGQFLSSLVLGLDNAWARSPMTKGPLSTFPPEPLRYLGSLMVRNAVRRKERDEDLGRRPRWIDRQLAKFAAVAGKADKEERSAA
ncbi:MAG: FAD-dependent oxidoreductase [Proteobacteria bacterium]|nr:FAD-dependent oxidoreductase [Pseudomonadota bacterium]